jgi:DNA polymerase III sliding clamp (beta) subunit (PCNA family)
MINSKDLLLAIKFVEHSMPTKDVRYYLNGVWLTPLDGQLRVEASSGTTLARCVLDVPGLKAEDAQASIAATALEGFKARLQHGAGTVSLDDTRTFTQLEGRKPEFDRVIPRNDYKGAPRIKFSAELMLQAMKAVKCVTSKKELWGVIMETNTYTDAVVLRIPTASNAATSMTEDALFLVMPMKL